MRWWQMRKRDADLERELRADLELEEEEQRANGVPVEEARYAALRAFGNPAVIREQTHEAWGWATMERLMQDVRYAVRQLLRAPGFTVVTVLTLALGIGATTAIFTLVYDVMLRPLPFAQADRLVAIEEKVAEWSHIYPTLPVNANHFEFWMRNNRSLEALAVMQQGSVPLGANGRPQKVGVLWATPGIFSVLQAQPALGRAFTEAEAQEGHEHVAVLMDSVWREQFGADPGIVGKTIRLNGFPSTVVGVMPRSFHMPSVQTLASIGERNHVLPIDVILPQAFTKDQLAEDMGDFNYFGLGRLRAGVSVAAAAADLDALEHTIEASLAPDEKARLSVALTPLQEMLVGSNRKPLLMLLGAVAVLLLVGCANVTNLLLARASGRRQQVAVAAALGARGAELVRMAIRETAVLAAVGGGLGIALAAAIVPMMQRYLPPALNFRGTLHLDWTGAGCALLLAVVTTLLAGAAPAFVVCRTAPQEVLHSESRLASESRGSRRVRRILVGVEVAVSVALVLLTSMLTASLIKLMHVERGFTTGRTVTALVDLPRETYPDSEHRPPFYREVLERIGRLPGVEHAAMASILPLMGDGWSDLARVSGDTRPFTQLPLESFRAVSPEYFSTIGLRVMKGNVFTSSDWGKHVALVSEKTAVTLWPGKDAVGQQFSRGGSTSTDKPFTVIGVVADARTISLAKPDPMMIYVPYWYRCEPEAGLVVRTHQDPSEMGDAIRQVIWSVDRNVPVPSVRALGGVVADSVANQRFEMDLLLLFAASALFLAGLGVYGVVMYSVVQRSREIGLRMALGAQRASVYRLVLRDGMLPVTVGVGAGVGMAFASAGLLRSLLFEVSPYDPALTAGAIVVLLAVGAGACVLPARRAAAVEPMQALRTE
ncbi:ABC transporter permease [Acidobacteria bacterium AB60]|nr:ABC transporter permease [Acidobacteria bacterium AB60]